MGLTPFDEKCLQHVAKIDVEHDDLKVQMREKRNLLDTNDNDYQKQVKRKFVFWHWL